MNGYLLDTNVVSELTSEYANPLVLASIEGRRDTWLSSIVVCEMEFGVQRLPMGRRRALIADTQARFLTEFVDRIIDLDRAAAEWAAYFRVLTRRAGRAIGLADALIAGTAKANELTLVTRNVRDFELLDIEYINPWEDALD